MDKYLFFKQKKDNKIIWHNGQTVREMDCIRLSEMG